MKTICFHLTVLATIGITSARTAVPRLGRGKLVPTLRRRSKKHSRDNGGGATRAATLEHQLRFIRGGGGVVDEIIAGADPKLAAKTLTLAYLLQGAAFSLAPRHQSKVYGWEGDSDVAEYLTQNLGAAFLGMGVASYCLLFLDMTVSTAIGSFSLVWFVNYVQWFFLTKTLEKLEAPLGPSLLFAALSCVSVYAGLSNASWAETYFKTIVPLLVASALCKIMFPASALKMLFPKQGAGIGDDVKKLSFSMRSFAYFLLAAEIYSLLLLHGADPVKAIAHASLVVLAYLLSSLLITREIGQVSKKPKPYVFWLVYFIFHIVTILMEGAGGKSRPVSAGGGGGTGPSSATQ